MSLNPYTPTGPATEGLEIVLQFFPARTFKPESQIAGRASEQQFLSEVPVERLTPEEVDALAAECADELAWRERRDREEVLTEGRIEGEQSGWR
tara:strand:- start:164 stop:445 length:282 start_codon:yes stop_codon:yes gene_type:complete